MRTTRPLPFTVWAFLPLALVLVLIEGGLVAWALIAMWTNPWARLIAVPVAALLPFVIRVVHSAFSPPAEFDGGVDLHADDHPDLWAEVTDVAERVGVPAPQRLVVTVATDVSSRDVGDQHVLEIGLPLLAVQSVQEFRSTVAHALAHRLSPRGHRLAQAAEQIRLSLSLSHGFYRWLLKVYSGVYVAVTAPALAAFEHEADEAAVRIVGPGTAIATLRRLVTIDNAWYVVFAELVDLFEPAGSRASLAEALLTVVDKPVDGTPERPDEALVLLSTTHLPVGPRIVELEATYSAGPQAPLDRRPVYELLRGGLFALDEAEAGQLVRDWPLTSWAEVAAAAGRHNVRAVAHHLGSMLQRRGVADTSLGGVLTILEHQDDVGSQRLGELWGLTSPEEEADVLGTVLAAALVTDGYAHFVPDLPDLKLVDRTGSAVDPAAMAREALVSPHDGALRRRLVAWGINLDGPVGGQDAGSSDWLASVSHMTGPWTGRCDLHVLSTGLLALPIAAEVLKEDKAMATTGYQRDRLVAAAAQGIDACRALPGAAWWPRTDILGGDVTTRLLKTVVTVNLADGTSFELKGSLESEYLDSPEAVGQAFGYLLSIPIEDSAK